MPTTRQKVAVIAAITALPLTFAGVSAVQGRTTQTVASCTANPKVSQVASGQRITVVCTVPNPVVVPTDPPTTDPPTADPTDEPTTAPTSDPTTEPTSPPTSDPTDPPTTTPPVSGDFPDAASTGVQSGVTLKKSGPVTASKDGQVVENLDITGNVTVTGKNVTVRNVRITDSGGGNGISAAHAQGLLVDHVTIGATPGKQLLVGVKDVYGDADMTITNSDISGWATGIQTSRGLVQDNYVHDPVYRSGDHTNGYTHNGGRTDGTMTVRHNTILNDQSQTDAVSLFQDFGPVKNVTIDDNLLAGGGYTIYGGGGATKLGQNTNVVITDNQVSTRYFADGGSYGARAHFDGSAAGAKWSGNVYADGPNKGKSITAPPN